MLFAFASCSEDSAAGGSRSESAASSDGTQKACTEVAELAVKALKNKDMKLYAKAAPEFYLKRSYYTSGNEDRMTYDEYIDSDYYDIGSVHDKLAQDFGDDFDITFEVESCTRLTEQALNSTKERWENDKKKKSDAKWDYPDFEDGYNMKCSVKISGSKNSVEYSADMEVYKTSGVYCTFYPEALWANYEIKAK